MTWRTIIIASNSKLDLKLGYMIIRNSELHKVHLSEISVLIIESTAVSMTAMLLCELNKRKVRIIFCDETHNPYAELEPFYGCHDCTEKLRIQLNWSEFIKDEVWAEIVRKKIMNQSTLMESVDANMAALISSYADQVTPGDLSNREGHAAKVYFNRIFGYGFIRHSDDPVNACLNYGYAIILSAINREIVSLGYNTQLGIFHDNKFNHFNLGSDLIEPIRIFVDRCVLKYSMKDFSLNNKRILANILNTPVKINGRTQFLMNAIPIYVKSVMDALESGDCSLLRFCDEGSGDESIGLF